MTITTPAVETTLLCDLNVLRQNGDGEITHAILYPVDSEGAERTPLAIVPMPDSDLAEGTDDWSPVVLMGGMLAFDLEDHIELDGQDTQRLAEAIIKTVINPAKEA